MTQDEIEILKKQARFETPMKDKVPYGGQSVGIVSRAVRLVHEDMAFDITIGISRSQLRNRELCMLMFELYLSAID